ncbi:hypothetical protein CYMTET_7170 [Cymbomonas tetramitiformis]|uniref:PiggyBac transposable element-derived protein domain-containing protein n=1 Tax=Cymbomonas tetramitiformis TaxID=36881 RepID=A0AAE0LHC2_9CHLO|nr:hypothetical protein CYMTET_7170 [Cymbomonas tetramitiformis]
MVLGDAGEDTSYVPLGEQVGLPPLSAAAEVLEAETQSTTLADSEHAEDPTSPNIDQHVDPSNGHAEVVSPEAENMLGVDATPRSPPSPQHLPSSTHIDGATTCLDQLESSVTPMDAQQAPTNTTITPVHPTSSSLVAQATAVELSAPTHSVPEPEAQAADTVAALELPSVSPTEPNVTLISDPNGISTKLSLKELKAQAKLRRVAVGGNKDALFARRVAHMSQHAVSTPQDFVFDASAASRLTTLNFTRLNVIDDYNYNMNGVDVVDQLRNQYRCDGPWMRQRKWWFPIFLWCIEVGCGNAYRCYQEMCKKGLAEGEKPLTHRRFIELLSSRLCGLDTKPAEKKGRRSSVEASGSSASNIRATRLTPKRVDEWTSRFVGKHPLEEDVPNTHCQWCKYKKKLAQVKVSDSHKRKAGDDGDEEMEISHAKLGCAACHTPNFQLVADYRASIRVFSV